MEILYIDDDIEVIPVWKQCGERDPKWSDDEKWLWDSGGFTQHMLFITKKKKWINNIWWVWKNYERGHIVKEKDNTYTAHLHINMTRSEVEGFKTIEEAARKVVSGRHDINPANLGPLFVTKDGKYYDLNNDEIKMGV